MSITPYSVGTTEGKIASRITKRTSLVIMNLHATAIVYVSFTKGVSVTNGIPVYHGGNISLKIPEDNPRAEAWAISDTAATPVIVYEGYGLE